MAQSSGARAPQPVTRTIFPLYRDSGESEGFAALPPRVLLAQEAHHGGPWVTPTYRHPFHTLSLVIAGHAKVTVRGVDHVRQGGSVLLFSPGIPYRAASLAPDLVYHSFILSFALGSKVSLPVSFPETRREPVGLVMEEARRLFHSPRVDQATLKALVLEVLSHAFAGDPVVEPVGPRLARRTREYLETRLGEPFSLARLAAQEKLGPSHFAHLFKKATGTSPREYYFAVKLSAAKRLLLETPEAIAGVSQILGFSSVHHFSRFFANQAGTPPATWRREQQARHTRPQPLPTDGNPSI